MTIFLAEEQNGQRHAERAFDSSVLAVGRDASECQITFDSVKWPMVSRKHAKFRLENGRYLLADSNSRYGTFLDGRRISEPTEVSAGARAQFGPRGPVLHVVRIESGVRSLESGVWSPGRKVWSPGRKVWSAEFGVWSRGAKVTAGKQYRAQS